jgi:hypothetical protein
MPNDNLDPSYVPVIKGSISLADIGKRAEPPKPTAAPVDDFPPSPVAALLAKLGA